MGLSLGGIGGIAGIAQLAAGPVGWASLAFQLLGSGIAQQAIQQIGKQLGVPQGGIDLAQNAFSAANGSGPMNIKDAVGQVSQRFGLSPTQQGDLERQSNKLLEDFTKSALEGKNNGDSEGSSKTKSGGKAESFLVAFAKALGKAMDTKMNKMMDISKKIDQETQKANKSEGKQQAVTGEMSAELQALGQELSMLSQAVANSVKSIGEAASTLARKN